VINVDNISLSNTAGVLPITSQRFGNIVREKLDVFYIGQLLSYDKKLYNFQRHTSDKNRTISTISYEFYRSSDISFRTAQPAFFTVPPNSYNCV